MTLKQFLALVEIRTKVASLIPFLAGIAFAYYRYDHINLFVLCPLFLSMLCIDLATTTLNNLMDFGRDRIKSGYHYEEHNAIGKYHLSIKKIKGVIFILLILGGIFGLLVAAMTDLVILLIGLGAFGVGIIYSYGPIPISRTPFGELFSGLFMGFLIFFVVIYTQIFEMGFINIALHKSMLELSMNYAEIIILFVVSMPLMMGIANIMLANNISDVNEDIENHRYTLPYYLGKKASILLFDTLTYAPWFIVTICVVLNLLPVTTLLLWGLFIPIHKNVKRFHEIQSKEKTFGFVVKNFILFSGAYTLTILIGDVIKLIVRL